MEILAILFWSVVLIADLAFMTQIPRLTRDFEHWQAKRKRPGGAGTPSQGMRHMTDAVYHFTHEMSKEVDPMTKAIIIRTSGDPQLCAAAAQAFESPKLRALKIENTVLRIENTALKHNREVLRQMELTAIRRKVLRQMELNAIRREVGAYISRHQRARKLRAAFWAQVSRLGLILTKGGAKA